VVKVVDSDHKPNTTDWEFEILLKVALNTIILTLQNCLIATCYSYSIHFFKKGDNLLNITV
jgi:hypothetical protein